MPRLLAPLMLLLALLGLPWATNAARERSAEPRTIPIHYKQQNLPEIVRNIARATGRQFVYGDNLAGRVTITVPGRVSEGEALELLNAALFLKGFAALPIGRGATKIVPIAETASSAPLVTEDLEPERERPITTLLRLEYANAESLATILGPLLPKSGFGLAYPPTNSLILAGTEAQVSRLISISQHVDRAASEDIAVFTLRYRSASALAAMIDTAFNQQVAEASRSELWSDERTNQIIISTRPDRLEEIRAFIRNLDRPAEGKGLIRVVPIINHDAEKLAEILNAMGEGSTSREIDPVRQRASSLGQELSQRTFSVTPDRATRSLLLVADPETLEVLIDLIAELDQMVQRIEVDVLIFEVSRPSSFKLGIEYFLPVTDPKSVTDPIVYVSTGASVLNPSGDLTSRIPNIPNNSNGVFARYVRDPLLLTFDAPDGSTITIPIPRDDVAFKLGQTSAEVNVLLRPNLVVVNGEESSIFIGNNIPVLSATSAADEGANNNVGLISTRQTIERTDVGIELRVQPSLGIGGMVTLDLEIELSGLGASQVGAVERVGPTFTNRNIKSTLKLFEGESVILGASSEIEETRTRSGIPFLMEIPFMGQFFGSTQKNTQVTDLIAVVKARILRDPEEDAAEAIRRRVAFERSVARTADLSGTGSHPYAILLETVPRESDATDIAKSFGQDGFETRVTNWMASEGRLWDIYLTGFGSFEETASLARGLSEAGWKPEITVLSPENEMAGD